MTWIAVEARLPAEEQLVFVTGLFKHKRWYALARRVANLWLEDPTGNTLVPDFWQEIVAPA